MIKHYNLCVAAFLLVASANLMWAGTISVQPSSSGVSLGNQASVDIVVSGISDLYAFQFNVAFDAAVLSAVNITEGSLFNNVGVFFSPGTIDNTAGTVQFISDSLSGPGPGVQTPGTLATLTFNTIGLGTSGINFANVILLDSQLIDISVATSNATINVTATSGVPESNTALLVFLALVAVGFLTYSNKLLAYRRQRSISI